MWRPCGTRGRKARGRESAGTCRRKLARRRRSGGRRPRQAKEDEEKRRKERELREEERRARERARQLARERATANLKQRMSYAPLRSTSRRSRRRSGGGGPHFRRRAHQHRVRHDRGGGATAACVSCEMAGGANLGGVVCALASRISGESDEFFTVGVYPCMCGGKRFWAIDRRVGQASSRSTSSPT